MFWKKKEIQKEKQGDEPEKDAVFSSCNTTILKRKTRHAKTIIENKLYDTEKAEFLCPFKDGRILLKTKRGNYFSCVQDIRSVNEEKKDEIVETVTISHYDLREETEEAVKGYMGIHELDLYIKLFGEVEEA